MRIALDDLLLAEKFALSTFPWSTNSYPANSNCTTLTPPLIDNTTLHSSSPEELYEDIIKDITTLENICENSNFIPSPSSVPCSPTLNTFSNQFQTSHNLLLDSSVSLLYNDLLYSQDSNTTKRQENLFMRPFTTFQLTQPKDLTIEDRPHCALEAPNEYQNMKASRKGKKHKKIRIQPNRCIHLWQFLRELLESNDYGTHVISWTCKEKQEFRLIDTKAVAELWGIRKNRGRMTYEKMARTMRYYYKLQILERVPKKRLHFRFGKARLWTKL